MKRVLTLLSLILPLSVAAQIYSSTDKNGNPVFSDVPTEGAVEIKLSEPTTVDSLAVDPSLNIPPSGPKKVEKFHYEEITITSPKNDEAIRDNTGNITITATIKPGL